MTGSRWKFLTALVLVLAGLPAYASMSWFNSAGLQLGNFAEGKCSTGVTCTVESGKLKIVSSPTLVAPLTLENGEIINNTTNDTVQIISDNEAMVLAVTGFEAKAAEIAIWADEGDDAADKFRLSVSTSDVLSLINGVTTIKTWSSAGVETLADSETITDASDVISIGFDDAAANVKLVAFEATDASLTLQADESDDNGDDWRISSVASGNALTISNDTSGSFVAKLSMAASDGDLTLTGGLLGDGGDTISGFLQAQVTSTTTTLTIAQCGSTIVNDSTDVLTLPEASTALGCRYTFATANASNFDVNPADGTDQIVVLTNAAGDAIRNATIGNSVTLEAIGADTWGTIAISGTWSDVN